VIAQEARPAEQGGAGGEFTDLLRLGVGDVAHGGTTTEQSDETMGFDMGNFRERPFELVGGAQDVRTQRVGCLQHEERLVAFGEDPLEFLGRLRDRIVGNYQAIDGRIRGDSQGTVNARCGKDHENRDDPRTRTQDAKEDFMHMGQQTHSIDGGAHLPPAVAPDTQTPGPPARGNDSLKT
jgi:hypothetical protein